MQGRTSILQAWIDLAFMRGSIWDGRAEAGQRTRVVDASSGISAGRHSGFVLLIITVMECF
uniref:Uncharacterized protein n=1 Tax=Candidatus Nitrotoga fabula TaxID=2182327 RepID=A0A2X0R7C8_9PROT|nr:protein of unknown function [Candidatus Nitrotoga fabula]